MTSQQSTSGELRLYENQNDPAASSVSAVLFALAVGVFIAARLWRLAASCLWFDEVFGVHAARHNWADLFRFVAADLIHPPLFYALLKVWIGIGGESLLWLRLLPVVASVAAIVPFVLLCRELRLNAGERNLALALLAVNGYLIKYAQEVRMYSLLFFFTLASLWLFVKFINAKEHVAKLLLALTVVNLLLVYTHYYGWVVVTIELFTLIIWWRSRVIKFIFLIATLILSYLPWLYLVTISKEPGRGLAQNIGWVPRPSVSDVVQFFSMLNTPFFFRQSSASSRTDVLSILLSFIVFGLPLLILIWQVFKERASSRSERDRIFWWLLSVSLLPLAMVFVLSWILPHAVWGTRHLIIVAGPYSILAAGALLRLRPARARIAGLALLGFWLLVNGAVFALKRPTNFIWCTWEPLAQQVRQAEKEESNVVQVYAFEDLVAYHLWFGLVNARAETSENRFKVNVVKGVPGLLEDPAYFLPRRFYDIETHDGLALKGETIWIAFRDSQWNTQRPPLNLIDAQGYETANVVELRAQGQKAFLVKLRRKGQMK